MYIDQKFEKLCISIIHLFKNNRRIELLSIIIAYSIPNFESFISCDFWKL